MRDDLDTDSAACREAEARAHGAEARLAETLPQLAQFRAHLTEAEARLADTEARLADTLPQLAEFGAHLTEAEARLVADTEGTPGRDAAATRRVPGHA